MTFFTDFDQISKKSKKKFTDHFLGPGGPLGAPGAPDLAVCGTLPGGGFGPKWPKMRALEAKKYEVCPHDHLRPFLGA